MSILWRDSLSKEPSGYLVGWVLRKENNGFCSTVSKGDWIIPCAVMSSSIKLYDLEDFLSTLSLGAIVAQSKAEANHDGSCCGSDTSSTTSSTYSFSGPNPVPSPPHQESICLSLIGLWHGKAISSQQVEHDNWINLFLFGNCPAIAHSPNGQPLSISTYSAKRRNEPFFEFDNGETSETLKTVMFLASRTQTVGDIVKSEYERFELAKYSLKQSFSSDSRAEITKMLEKEKAVATLKREEYLQSIFTPVSYSEEENISKTRFDEYFSIRITIKKKLNQFKSLLKTNDKVPHTVQDSIVVRNKTRKLTNDKILFFIDLVLGIILSITLFSLRGSMDSFVLTQTKSSSESTHDFVEWLQGFPCGIKLNTNLDNFFANIINSIYKYLTISPALMKSLLLTLPFAGLFGASVLFSWMSDLLILLFAREIIVFKIISSIYSGQFNILLSLLNLFRGQKFNPLRQRVDTCPFEAGQLMYGTVLFAIAAFLFPTTVFYELFVVCKQLVIIISVSVIGTIVIILQDFPIFPVFRQLLHPLSNVKSITFEPCTNCTTERNTHVHLKFGTASPAIYLSPLFKIFGSWFGKLVKWLLGIIQGKSTAPFPAAN